MRAVSSGVFTGQSRLWWRAQTNKCAWRLLTTLPRTVAARRWNDGGQGASPQGSVSILLVVLYANHVVVQNPSTQQQSLVRTTNARTFVVWSHFLSVKGRGRPAGQGERRNETFNGTYADRKAVSNRYNGVNSSLKTGKGFDLLDRSRLRHLR